MPECGLHIPGTGCDACDAPLALNDLRQRAAARDGKRTAHREASIAYMVELHGDQYQTAPCDCVPQLCHRVPPERWGSGLGDMLVWKD